MNNVEACRAIAKTLSITEEEAVKIFDKAVAGQEVVSEQDIDNWFNNRFLPNIVLIDEDGYAKMCIDALKILGTTAATDYGGSRQRDLGQLWADMTRGYLGELAFLLYLKKRWHIDAELGHEIGHLEDYLPMDIHQVREESGKYRTPKLKISVKTTKWNGIWLDIPGDQFNHSDIHVLIKVGTGRDHLFAFFKKISVFRDKVLKRGVEIGALTDKESESLFDNLPTFRPVPAYICGFVPKNKKYDAMSYSGKKGRKNYTITSWNGPIRPGDLDLLRKNEGVSGSIKFEGIGSFAHDSGYLFNTGNLLWEKEDWKNVIDNI